MKLYLVWLKGRKDPISVEADQQEKIAAGDTPVRRFLVDGDEIAVFPENQVQGITEVRRKPQDEDASAKPVANRGNDVYQPRV